MNKKMKKELNRQEKKKRNEKLMAMAIAGGILASTAPTALVSAETISTEVELNVLAASAPVIDVQQADFYAGTPNDVLFFVTEYNGTTLDYVTVNGERVPEQYISDDGMFVTVSKQYLATKTFENKEKFTIGGVFSNGEHYDIVRVTYYNFANEFDKPVEDEDDVVVTPTIKPQSFEFYKASPNLIAIYDVVAGDADVSTITFGDYVINRSDIVFDEGIIFIQMDALIELDMEYGLYSLSVVFTDGTIVNSGLTLTVAENRAEAPSPEVPTPEVPTPDVPSEDEPPVEDDNAGVETPSYVFNKTNPSDLHFSHGYYDKEITSVYIDGIYFSVTGAETDLIKVIDGVIVVTPEALEKVGLDSKLYTYTVEYADYSVSWHSFTLSVVEDEIVPPVEEDKPGNDDEVVPPVEEDKPGNDDIITPPVEDVKDEVVFDKNAPTDLQIPGLEIGDAKIASVVINGEEFNVEYRTALARASIKPSVFIVDGKLVVPVAVLEYLGLDSESLDIKVTLEDGTVLSKTVTLNVVDSSDKEEEVVPPTTDEEDGTTDKDDSTDKDEPVVDDSTNDSINNGTGSNGTVSGGNTNTGSNGTTNSTPSTDTNGSTSTQLPNTGAPVSAGLVGGLLTTVGAFLSRKKK